MVPRTRVVRFSTTFSPTQRALRAADAVAAHSDGGDPVLEFPSAARVDAPTRRMVRTLVDKLLAEAEDAPAWATISRGYEFEFAPLWGSLIRTGHSIRLSASVASLRAVHARGITELPS